MEMRCKMANYIDRDQLLRDITKYNVDKTGKFQHWVEIQHVVDVAPVVRGHWHVIKTNCAGMIVTSYQCTVCGKTCATQMRIFHDDVPMCCCWCGAQMDKERLNNETD